MSKIIRVLSVALTICMVIGIIITAPAPASAATITSYPLPSVYTQSTVYSLKAGGVTIPVVSYTGDYDYANFSMSGGSTTIEITATGQSSISSYSISPKKLNLTGTKSGNKLTFTISKDEYLIVQINSLRRLIITADPGETDKPASSGTGVFNVKASPYNADSTGADLSTTAIQNAINDASSYNGGIVYIPAGVYKVADLQLKSNIKLYMEGGAVLRPSTVKTDYTMRWHKNSINKDITWWLYTPTGATNIKIYGRGTIDGNSSALSTFASNLLVPIGCSYFTVQGITFRDSSSWSVTPARSNNLSFTNVKFLNRLNGAENDGIDVCESQNVTVTNSIGIGLDDPYTTKTWDQATDISVNWPEAPEVVDNVVFDDCISWTICYGFKIGQGTRQNQSAVTFKNSVVYDCAVALGIHHKYGTGTVSGVTFDNIDIEKVSYSNDSKRTWMVILVQDGDSTGGGPINNTTVKNITVRDRGTTAAMLHGISTSSSINGVTLNNIYMPGSSTPAKTMYEMNITDKTYYSNVTILPVQDPEPIPRTNLALNKPVTVSSTENSSGSYAVDGNLSTRWGSLRTDPQWIYVDLGTATNINGVKLKWEAAYGKTYKIQVSNNASTWTDVFSTSTGDGGDDDISFTTTSARYVRMYGTERGTTYGYSLWEFEVYSPTPAVTYEAENAALSNNAVVVNSASCSEGKKVGNIGGTNNGRASFTVNSATAGTKTMTVYYCSGETRTFYVTVNTGGYVGLSCPSTGGYDTVGSKTMTVNLNAGNNTILFNNGTGAFAPDLDRITIN